jgi:ornithine cyclodeaminase/alanine dehydrogenase-like protein (mu-crystallin family)
MSYGWALAHRRSSQARQTSGTPQVAQAGHDPRVGCGADLGAVLVEMRDPPFGSVCGWSLRAVRSRGNGHSAAKGWRSVLVDGSCNLRAELPWAKAGRDDVLVELILHDGDVLTWLTATDAVRWAGEAVDAHHRGELSAPARIHADFGDSRLVFTTGRLRGSWFGYRSYDTFPADPGVQVVVVHDEASGQVRAVAIGNELGPRRTGAIGAVAADALVPPGAGIAAIIGAGTQAYTQLWALAAVRELREVRVYSRDPDRRRSFAARAQPLVPGVCRPAPDARSAVVGAQIVVLATSSPVPVIDAAWVAPGSYVTTLGPKQRGRAEFGPDLPGAASLLVTDSPDQIGAYHPPNMLAGTPHQQRLVSLGAIRAGQVPPPGAGGISLFFSVGLAGTEAFLLDRLAASINARRR